VLDLVEAAGESFLVLEYVLGETLAGLVRSGARCSIPVAVAMIADALRGLDSAHWALGAGGQPLSIVHRNICPENLLVGVDGVTRVIDFGAARSTAAPRAPLRDWPPNAGYAAPEQLMKQPIDRRADIFSVGVVLWETLTAKRLFRTPEARDAFLHGTDRTILPASTFNTEVPRSLDEVVFRALGWLPEERFGTAAEFADELEKAVYPASKNEVSEYVEKKAAARLKAQRALLSAIDAPSGRISEPLGGRLPERYEDETVVFQPDYALLNMSAPKHGRSRSTSSALDALREQLAMALDRRSYRPRFSSFASLYTWPFRQSMRRGGSTVLTGAGALLLLLAAMKFSGGTPSRTPAATPSLLEPVAAVEVTRATNEADGQKLAAAAMDVAPVDPWHEVQAIRPSTEPSRANASDPAPEPDRARPKVPARRARGSCEPPFTLDAQGVKRLKPQCF
jgi:serine/threonine-protein kinase